MTKWDWIYSLFALGTALGTMEDAVDKNAAISDRWIDVFSSLLVGLFWPLYYIIHLTFILKSFKWR